MFIKAPSQEQREAIARLIHTRDGQILHSYLEMALADAHTKVAVSDDPARTRLIQGEQRTLLDIQKLMNPVS